MGNGYVVLSFTCPTIELNLFIECKTAKSDEGKKAAANLAAYSLSIDTYITNTEKENKLRKTCIFFQSIRKCSRYKLIFNLLSKTIENQL